MPSREDDRTVRRKNGGHKRTPPTKLETAKSRKRRMRNREMYAEAMRFAEQLDITLASDDNVSNIIIKIIQRTHALWLHAASKTDELDPELKPGEPNSIFTYRFDEQGNKLIEPSKWVAYEKELRQELFSQVALAQKLNIDEAAVRVEAAKLDLLSRALRNSMKKAQVPDEMQRRIGSALREELTILEGTAHDTIETEEAA